MTRRVLGTLLSAFACLLAACSSSIVTRDAKADEKTAVELAERLFPGELAVFSSESIFPRGTGSKVIFSVRDDPDAAIQIDLRLTNKDLIKTLAGSEHHRTLTLNGQQSVGDVLFPAMSFDEGEKFGAKLESAARDWLAKADLNPKPGIGRYLSLANRLEPGTVDRMRSYVTVCYSASEKPPCQDEGAIGFTVDLPTGATHDFTLIRKVKDDDGYHYPFEKP